MSAMEKFYLVVVIATFASFSVMLAIQSFRYDQAKKKKGEPAVGHVVSGDQAHA